ncbi:hypothetical protein TMS3_0104365 [Pseudomonas taeanensis MS-3]|jgi:N-acyl-L-homoserine lactone synthetase|uniref:Acyl-homoserine-lactone synthase n=1 Tax=Pseudomonas taeanensis MS-3 TaxID=1395571 RepID=A0A0A1YQL2_9PSED|nr:acyl-homoserine-lactone synthase [Pseudomonas taeanensis]KFX71174.1 hypothetical protein TMS3_0104365 [Pseudomonas taeanensis MS-3]
MRESRPIPPLLTLGRELPNLHAFQRLREAVFARELRWVRESATGLEHDSFDADSVHVAVSHGWHAAGYLRITPQGAPWMLQQCFDFLLDPHQQAAVCCNSMEVSRLAVAREYRGRRMLGRFGVFDLLIKGLVQHSQQSAVRYWWVVVAEPIYRLLLSKGLPCTRLGPIVRMPDGVETLAVRIDLHAFLNYADPFYSDQPLQALG